ncbi:MAG TPA: helix-turn-helix domain-containing protein [Solirubrobacterales bacterium]|nr:helix-turn-helix domain-containing protein [Solirubrobacterales bacterium]
MEIEQAVLTRIYAVSNPADAQNGNYSSGLRLAISAGVSHGLAGVEMGEDRAKPVPLTLLSQTRQAARRGIGFDVLLRRYFAGYTLFGDFIMQAVDDGVDLRGSALRRVLHAQAALFERLLLAVFGEYTRASASRHRPDQSQADLAKRLLAGDPIETGALAYEFEDWHVGVVARGAGAASALRDLADAADRRLLLIRPEGRTVWAWFGGRRRIAVAEFAERIALGKEGDVLVALGEPARGLEGWRLTHQQASAALSVAHQGNERVVRYADVGLLASISRDPVLAKSLHLLYLAPLADGRDGGIELRKTLRAYFTAGRNVTSAASALGVSRQTVGNRLRVIEEKLGRTIESCAPEIEVALRLD